MKRTVNFKKMVSIATSALVMASMFAGFTANAAVTYSKLTYSAGNVDGIVGSAEVSFDKVINTTFDAAAASRFSRKGYTVASWNVPSTGETVELGAQYKMPAKDITFVANWEEAEYAVSFAGKGGKTADGKANLTGYKTTFGTAMTLPECQFIYNGYTFAGWKYDGTVYNAGDEFEVPALLSGSKVVFAATWSAGEAAVTTAAATKATTTTTTTTTTTMATTTTTTEAAATTEKATTTTEAVTETTTTAAETAESTTEETTTTEEETTVIMENYENVSDETEVNSDTEYKTFDINAEVDFSNDSSKMYQVSLDEIRSYGSVEGISINLRASEGNIGQLVMGVSSTVNGNWTQVDFNENIDSDSYTLSFGDEEVCAGLDGEYLQIGYWYGSSESLYISSITVEYNSAENNEAEAEPEAEAVSFDYNNDGIVDMNDADALRKYLVGVDVEGFEITAENADVNGDGAINVFDYMALTRICG